MSTKKCVRGVSVSTKSSCDGKTKSARRGCGILGGKAVIGISGEIAVVGCPVLAAVGSADRSK